MDILKFMMDLEDILSLMGRNSKTLVSLMKLIFFYKTETLPQNTSVSHAFLSHNYTVKSKIPTTFCLQLKPC